MGRNQTVNDKVKIFISSRIDENFIIVRKVLKLLLEEANMCEVFSKSYLEEVVENQGKLFEYAEEHYPGIDVANFIESYMKSHTRAMADEGQAYVCTMDAETLYNSFLENDKYEPKQGKTAGGFAPNWIGQFYALFQWIYRLPSKEVVKTAPDQIYV